MKKLFTLLAVLAMFAIAGCEQFGGNDNIVGGSYAINGAIQKGPFIQGSTITIQPLNENLKPIGQIYTTLTTNDAGMFEMDGVNSKYAEIIATGYYFDEVDGKISSGMLTLRSIADLKYNSQTNVNLLTTLTYNRIKNLVTDEGKEIAEAQEQAEKELYTALGIPSELQPNVGCGAMNIATNGDGNGLLLAISAVLQNGRTVGELSEYIAKFGTDLADDGAIQQELLQKFCVYGFQSSYYEDSVIPNLEERYKSLGIECAIPNFVKYLPYLNFKVDNSECVIYFTYDETYTPDSFNDELGREEYGIDELVFGADVEFMGYEYNGGYGVIYLSAPPKIISQCQCDAITSISIPNSVTTIGEYAFEGCLNLMSISIPDSVTSIKKRAFNSCLNLSEVTIGENTASIGEYAFSGCTSLTNIVFSNSVSSIGKYAFERCEKLTDATIPDGVTSIEEHTFGWCTDLRSITLPNSITSIGDYAFENCTYLANINIPNGVTYIGQSAFSSCQFIGFDNHRQSIAIPDSVTFIGNDAFNGCTNLERVTLGKGITSIRNNTFRECVNLKYIHIPDNVTSIGNNAFYRCKHLEYIIIPESVTQIGECAFGECKDMTSITIPASVTLMEWNTFSNCINLAEVYCKPTTPPTGGYGMFQNTSSELKIYVPTESIGAYKSAEYWSNYMDYFVGYDFEKDEEYGSEVSENQKIYYTSTTGDIINPNSHFAFGAQITSNRYENGQGVIVFNGDVTEIGDSAFKECSSLASIIIPDSVTSIGGEAFCDCIGLESINIPESVTSIGKYAFLGCPDLQWVYIGNGVSSIGEGAFCCCSSLTDVFIPDSVISIGNCAFYFCDNLASVYIGSGVTSIEYAAFQYCPSLAEVYCEPIIPPIIICDSGYSWAAFEFNAPDRKIYVPTESVEEYKSSGWCEYADDIVGYDF